MNRESQLLLELWDMVRDNVPTSRRHELAISFIKSFEEYGVDPEDIRDVCEEDPYLQSAFADLHGDDEGYDDEDYDDEEDY